MVLIRQLRRDQNVKNVLFCLICLFGAICVVGCEENQSPTTAAVIFAPRQDIEGLSADSASIVLNWVAPPGAVDSGFGGYIVRTATTEDTIPTSNLGYLADSLPAGETTFTLLSYLTDG